jgi:prephenate dehydrogenase
VKTAIIGGSGRMGRWFAKYFKEKGFEVILSDIKREEAKETAKSLNVELAKNNINAVKNADLTVISTPIKETTKVLREIASVMKDSSTVMEISSIKANIISVLKEVTNQKINTISIHPLFGPGIKKINEEKIVLIPVNNPSSEMRIAKKIFPNATIIKIDQTKHDRIMAITLSLPHFMSMVFAEVIGEEDLEVLKKLGGPTFTLQLAISEAVMTEDPKLYAQIQMTNEYTKQFLNKFLSKAQTLKRYIEKKEIIEFSSFYNRARASFIYD